MIAAIENNYTLPVAYLEEQAKKREAVSRDKGRTDISVAFSSINLLWHEGYTTTLFVSPIVKNSGILLILNVI